MDIQLLKNLVGTAYNVLLEQDHPSLKECEAIIMELRDWNSDSNAGAFDLRYRDAKGKSL